MNYKLKDEIEKAIFTEHQNCYVGYNFCYFIEAVAHKDKTFRYWNDGKSDIPVDYIIYKATLGNVINTATAWYYGGDARKITKSSDYRRRPL